MKKIQLISIFMMISILLTMNVCFANSTPSQNSVVANRIQETGINIINAILWIGYAIALGMVLFIGIKYVLGAADAKANMKGAVVNWLIGAFIVFIATTIIGVVLNVMGVSSNTDSHGAANEIVHALD